MCALPYLFNLYFKAKVYTPEVPKLALVCSQNRMGEGYFLFYNSSRYFSCFSVRSRHVCVGLAVFESHFEQNFCKLPTLKMWDTVHVGIVGWDENSAMHGHQPSHQTSAPSTETPTTTPGAPTSSCQHTNTPSCYRWASG